MEKKLHPKISVRLFTDEKCFGPGIAALLSRVGEYRSLRAAAASMGMAYSKAWTVLKNCESNLGFKLLNSTVGGKNGGGAELTEDGAKMLVAYNKYCVELNEYAERLADETFALFEKGSSDGDEL